MRTIPYVCILLLAASIGCQERRAADASPRQESSDAARAAKKEAEEVHQALVKRLDQLDGEIEKIEKKAEKASAKTKAKLEEQAKGLRADARSLRNRMSTWDDKAESAWKTAKRETEEGLEKAEHSIRKALDDIKN